MTVGGEGPGPAEPEWRRLNRANWDERTPHHVASAFYDVDGFLAGQSTLRPFEVEELGPVFGRSLVHLQCHFGLDTLSWAREGAEVTGLDFSAPAVLAARDLARRAGLEARFVEADVYDAPEALGRRFDVVYTGRGALNWLPDIAAWAEVVARLLLPGGRLYLVEAHPFVWGLADDSLDFEYDYFPGGRHPYVGDDDPGDYADPEVRLVHAATREFAHPLGSIVTGLAAQGLVVERLVERPEIGWPRFPFLVRLPGPRRHYGLPDYLPTLPLELSLLARAPW